MKGRGAMNFLLAILSASAHSVNSISLRLYQTNFQKSVADLRLFQGLAMLLAAVCYWGLNRFSLQLETAGLLLALCYGLDLVLTGITVSICYLCGPMSLTSVISNACVVLPIAVGCIFYQEIFPELLPPSKQGRASVMPSRMMPTIWRKVMTSW